MSDLENLYQERKKEQSRYEVAIGVYETRLSDAKSKIEKSYFTVQESIQKISDEGIKSSLLMKFPSYNEKIFTDINSLKDFMGSWKSFMEYSEQIGFQVLNEPVR
jgi:hypothetical protein